MSDPVIDYIRENWMRSVYRDSNGSGFKGIDLPFQYTSPCIKGEGKFYFFFYWDTYFTNVGLLAHGLTEVARDNIRNMVWLIQRQGYMPNHVGITNRSQPPYLCRMVQEYVEATGDEAFLAEVATWLRQEYHFWTTARHTPTGLQRHGHHDTADGCQKFYGFKRVQSLGNGPDAPASVKEEVGGNFLAEAETGWDFNQRFGARCLDHNAVDLNGLLYSYETYLGDVAAGLGWDDEALWRERAETRRSLTTQYLWSDERRLFLDYDFVNQRQSPVASLAGMLPLFTGLATKEQAAAMHESLTLFERDYGVAVTEERDGCRNYQWAFPNAWPPLTYVTVEGLRRYGYEDAACRLAKKFVNTTRSLFEKTGQLWEKTDAETGEVAGGEYDAAAMLGWTAGTYCAFVEDYDIE